MTVTRRIALTNSWAGAPARFLRGGLFLALIGLLALGVFLPLRVRAPIAGIIVPLEQQWLELPGWTWRSLPLGSTELLTRKTLSHLQYDSYLHREYRRGALTFSILVGYWRPGRISPQTLASHAPEHCLVAAGWTCDGVSEGASLGAGQLKGADFGVFVSPRGERLNVYHWHFLGGEPHNYGTRRNVLGFGVRWVQDGLRQIVRGPQEQYLIRLLTPNPTQDLDGDAEFPRFAAELERKIRLGRRR